MTAVSTEADVQTLAAWVDAGAPEGDAKDMPPPIEWRDGWNIKPDVVIEMPKPYNVPGRGTIEYTYFVVPSGFTKDTWVIDAEVRPGNRTVVHHGSVHIRPPGSQWLKDAKVGEGYVLPKRSDGGDALPAPVDPSVNVSNDFISEELHRGRHSPSGIRPCRKSPRYCKTSWINL